jgi:hypothetical protein
MEGLRNLEFTASSFPKLYPIVLLARVGWRLSGDLGSEVGRVVGS